jgi:hypothetical protein
MAVRLPTAGNIQRLTPDELAEWDAAIDEYNA